MEEIPFEKFHIPRDLQEHLRPDSPPAARLAAARGLIPMGPEVQIAVCYILANDEKAPIRDAARSTLQSLPSSFIVNTISQSTHSKILEWIAVLRTEEQDIATKIMSIRNANDRTVTLLAEKAAPDLCERLSYNQERLLITPGLLRVLHANRNCSDANLERAYSFLRMHRCAPAGDWTRRPWDQAAEPEPPQVSSSAIDLEAEIEAALRGEQSPTLQARTEQALKMFDLDSLVKTSSPLADFDFSFRDDSDVFGWDMTEDRERVTEDEKLSLEMRVANMTVGSRIKLAYLGNKEVRHILIRDRNKMVATAVVRSGRCSDGEIANFATNRNLPDEVLREIALNPEWTRKYPIKVSLVNNPKCPVGVAVSLVAALQRKELQELSHNHNVSSVITQSAKRLFNQKFKKG